MGTIAPKLQNESHARCLQSLLEKFHAPPIPRHTLNPSCQGLNQLVAAARSITQHTLCSGETAKSSQDYRTKKCNPQDCWSGPNKENRPVMYDVFSGTGSVGSVFRQAGWDVYSIDICKKAAKRSEGLQCCVLKHDWKSWPQPRPDRPLVVWLSPPCTPFSNATPRTKRLSAPYKALGRLAEWSISFAQHMRPKSGHYAWIMENPSHTSLRTADFLKIIPVTFCSYCRYGRDYRKDTSLWHSDSIKLNLNTCICKGPHKVKLGGNYGGTPGCRKWSKPHMKGSVPHLLTQSIVEQIMSQWNMGTPKWGPPHAKRPRIIHAKPPRPTECSWGQLSCSLLQIVEAQGLSSPVAQLHWC